jgi:peptidoglycan/xylan/chitin deacetylase (PgdA/CDA1 family)
MGVPVLMYHSVCAPPGGDPSPFVVSRRTFEAQLRYLRANGYYSPTLAEALAPGFAPPPGRRPVLLTFDDGYADNHTVALPLLLEHGFRAALFPVSDLGRGRTWWGGAGPRAQLLAPAQIREMAACGIEVGSHGISHRRMSQLDDRELQAELHDSRAALEDILGQPVRHLAYPYGDVDDRTKRAVRAAGYTAAFAVNSGPLGLRDDPFEIRRVLVGNIGAAGYMFAKVMGIEKLVRWGRWAWRMAARF